MTDNLRNRIAAAVVEHDGGWIDNGKPDTRCRCGYRPSLGEAHSHHVADAVMEVITVCVPPILASAIHSYADSELAAISHHGSGDEYEMLKRLNSEAARIATYATTHERWNGARKPA